MVDFLLFEHENTFFSKKYIYPGNIKVVNTKITLTVLETVQQ